MRSPIAVAVAATLAIAAVPAGAVDDTKPTPCDGALLFKDPTGDNTNTAVPEADRTQSTEIIGGFIKHDPAKGAEATTYNIVVQDLKQQVPSGYTTIGWAGYYVTPDDTPRFVRAIADFGGGIVFEHGSYVGAVVTGANVYEADTPGKLFEGPEGIVQVVIPAEHSPAGAKYTGIYTQTTQGRTLPGQIKTPTRGFTQIMDTGPDDGDEAGVTYTVAPCASAPAPIGGTTPPPTGGGGGGGTTPPPASSGNTKLPVTVTTKSLKAKQPKKAAKLKLKSSEKVTNLAAQLRKGRKVVGTGKLASLNGTGSLTLKLKSKKLKKGTYVLDLAGNDAAGKRLIASYALKVK